MKVMSNSLGLVNTSVPSCLLPVSESSCKTIHMKMCFDCKVDIHASQTHFHIRFCTKTHFETEAKCNSEIAYAQQAMNFLGEMRKFRSINYF